MKISSKIIALILLIIVFGGVGIAKSMNVWKTESTKVPAKFKSGEFEGKYNPEDIRGSYAFSDISDAFEIDVDVLAKAFGIENYENVDEFKVKDFENIYASLAEKGTEIGTSSVKLFVALYKGLPYDLTEDTYIPQDAVEILKQKGNLTKEQFEYIEKHSVKIESNSSVNKVEVNETEESNEDEEKVVKGKTTFKEVIDFGVSEGDIEKIIGEKIPNTGLTVRDYCTEKGIEFSTVKEELQKKIDEAK